MTLGLGQKCGNGPGLTTVHEVHVVLIIGLSSFHTHLVNGWLLLYFGYLIVNFTLDHFFKLVLKQVSAGVPLHDATALRLGCFVHSALAISHASRLLERLLRVAFCIGDSYVSQFS